MSRYKISIVLENADKSDYKKLNRELVKERFKTIRKNEYGFEGNISILDVNYALRRVTQRIGKRPLYTVMKEKVIRH